MDRAIEAIMSDKKDDLEWFDKHFGYFEMILPIRTNCEDCQAVRSTTVESFTEELLWAHGHGVGAI